jgi:hypothetical protein
MRAALWLLAMGVVLAFAGTASAGCWATVGVSPLPNVGPGETWTANVQVLQHGRTPMADATPTVLIENRATGEQRAFPASLVDPAEGRYRAAVVFPEAGSWSVAVHDGFPTAECAQTHTFGAYAVGTAAPPAEPPAPVESAVPDPAAPLQTAASRPASAAGGGSSSLALGLGLGLGLAALALAGALGVRVRHSRAARAA